MLNERDDEPSDERQSPREIPMVVRIIALLLLLTRVAYAQSDMAKAKEIPASIAGAWNIENSISGGENLQANDPSRGNLLLLLDSRLFIAADRNSAEGRDFAVTPAILDLGFQIIAVAHKERQVLALAEHDEGRTRISMVEAAENAERTLVIKIHINANEDNDVALSLHLTETDQQLARDRIAKLLDSALVVKLRGKLGDKDEATRTKSKIGQWIAHAETGEPRVAR